MAGLYSISTKYLYLMQALEECDGEITPEVAEMLKKVDQDKDELLETLCEQSLEHTYDAAMVKQEIERLTERMKSATKKADRINSQIIQILHLFEMRNPAKKSKNYVFNSSRFAVYTKSNENVEYNSDRLIDFKPLVGKTSKFIQYGLSTKFDADKIKVINETGLVPETDYSISVDKTAAKKYVLEQTQKVPKQLEIGEEPVEEELDPILNIASVVTNESLIIK